MRALLLDRRAQPVRNIHPRGNNPSLANGWGAQTPNGNTVTFPATEGPTGGPCMRVELTTAGQLRMQHNTPTAGLRIPVPASTLLTVAAWVYSPRALTQCSFENQFFNAAGTGLFIRGSEFSLAPGWQFVRSTVTSTSTAVSLGQCQVITQNAAGNSGVVGDVFRMARAMVVIGSYDGVYCDGNTPNWKWLGTPLLSESVGWPYTIASVAGAPRWDAEFPALATDLPGTYNEHTSFGYGDILLSGQKGWLASIPDAEGRRWETLNISATSRVPYARVQVTGGGGTGTVSPVTDRSIFASWWAADGAIGVRSYDVNLGTVSAGSTARRPTPGYRLRSGVRDQGVGNGLTLPRQIVYDRVLSDVDRLAVARWLANRYGVTLAT